MIKKTLFLICALLISSCASTENGEKKIENSASESGASVFYESTGGDEETSVRGEKSKDYPYLSDTDIDYLQDKGFKVGVWGEDCSDVNQAYIKIYIEEGRLYGDVYQNKIRLQTRMYYNLIKLTDNVYILREYVTDAKSSSESIAESKIGYSAGSKMLFDKKVIHLNGPLKDVEVIVSKDGFKYIFDKNSVTKKSSTLNKPTSYCGLDKIG